MTAPYGDLSADDVARTVTGPRVVGAVRRVAGDPVVLGPLATGPGGTARATIRGPVRECTAQRDDVDGLVSYLTRLDLALDLEVVVAGSRHGFDVELVVPLRVTATGATPEAVRTTVMPPRPDDMTLVLRPRGLQARLLSKVAGVEQIVRQEAAEDIARRIGSADARAAMLLAVEG